MTISTFLSAITEALLTRVEPAVGDPRSRDALYACVRALAGLAATYEPIDPTTLGALPRPTVVCGEAVQTTLKGPAENPAANQESITAIALGAEWLASGAWLGDPQSRKTAEAMLRWEKAVGRKKVATMMRREQTEAGGDTARLMIDAESLKRYLAGRHGVRELRGFRQMIGGRSRQTALFQQFGSDELPERLVVQRDHPASISSLGVATQYPLLRRVRSSALRTPRALLLETDPDVLGAPFMLLEQASGTIAGADYFLPPQQPHLAYELAEQLAILHQVDPGPRDGATSVGAGWVGDLERLRSNWTAMKLGPSMTIDAAFAWMHAHVHDLEDGFAIVHNDAAFHNILVEDGHISALLDWELSHLGHPAEDLGYCRYFVQEIADWPLFVGAYVSARGAAFGKTTLDYFSLRAGIHLMTLLQYGRSMLLSGATSDINLAEAAASFVPKHHDRIATMLGAVLETDT